jgi:hypothetical protein
VLAAPVGRVEFVQRRATSTRTVEGWIGDEGVVLAIHTGPDRRAVLAAPTPDALPGLLLELIGPAPDVEHVVGPPRTGEPIVGTGDAVEEIPALVAWTGRWRVSVAWRSDDGTTVRDGFEVVDVPGGGWLVEWGDTGGWVAGPADPWVRWRRLLSLLPPPAGPPAPPAGAARMRVLPAFGAELAAPDGWRQTPMAGGRRVEAATGEGTAALTLIPEVHPDGGGRLPPLAAGTTVATLPLAPVGAPAEAATSRVVHHLDGSAPMTSLVWTSPARRRLPVGWTLVATVRTGRFLADLDVLLDSVSGSRIPPPGPPQRRGPASS